MKFSLSLSLAPSPSPHSATHCSQEYEGLQPLPKQSECEMGASLGPGAAVSRCLPARQWGQAI